jgi:hypothetical protein
MADDELGDGRLLLRDRLVASLVVDPHVDRGSRFTPNLALANPGAKLLHHAFAYRVASAWVSRAHTCPASSGARDPR